MTRNFQTTALLIGAAQKQKAPRVEGLRRNLEVFDLRHVHRPMEAIVN